SLQARCVMRIGHQSGSLLSSTATLGCVVFVIVARPIASMCAHKTAERASASRSDLLSLRDAVRALATGRVALVREVPSQGRRSLSRSPASGPQGFWPMELNLKSGSTLAAASVPRKCRFLSASLRFHYLRQLACRH